MKRHAFLDHLRVMLTVLVILHHTAIVYGGGGGWYWREQPDGSNRVLLLFNAINQSYFMGLFFLLAGYFTPGSYERKGAAAFLADRFLRLGLPLAVYFFVLSPFTIALARTADGHAFWPGWWAMIRAGVFEPGPLWFAEALLIFAVGYVVWRGRTDERTPAGEWREWPRGSLVLLAMLGIGAVSFIVRLVVPVGQNVAWLQLGYFPAYVLLFVVGCRAARAELLTRVTWPQVKPWSGLSSVMLVLLLVVMALRGDQGGFQGGWSFNAAFYAWWDPLVAWGVVLTLLWAFRTYWPRETPFSAALGRSAYAAYIVHPPVLVGCALLASGWSAPPLVKFVAVGAAACAGAFTIARGLLVVPALRKVL